MPNAAHEVLRLRYRPAEIRVLFVGESPPAGGTFFYAANSNLQRYTQHAFSCAYQREWSSGEAFLAEFEALGCYLDDLCLDPVNHLSSADRRQQWKTCTSLFAQRLQEMTPCVVISVMTATRRAVSAAIAQSGLFPQLVDYLPFPTFGNQHKYVKKLTERIHELRETGILI